MDVLTSITIVMAPVRHTTSGKLNISLSRSTFVRLETSGGRTGRLPRREPTEGKINTVAMATGMEVISEQ